MKTFGTLLYNLRKENKMTQSQLAEKLDLTDKAISRWENGESYPEVEKLLQLSKIFNVTVDELLNGELNVSLENNKIKKHVVPVIPMTKVEALKIFLGVSLIIVASFIWVIFFIFDGNQDIASVLFFVLLGLAVVIFIVTGMNKILVDSKAPEEVKKKVGPSIWMIALGVYAFILSPTGVAVLHDSLHQAAIGVVILIGFVIVGLGLVIIGGITWNDEFLSKYANHEKLSYEKKPLTLQNKLHAILWVVAPAIFVITGVLFNAWNINWIIFPLSGVISAIIGILFAGSDKKERKESN